MTDAPRASVAVWLRPLRRARQHSARWIAGPSERTTENRGISAAACRHHELPEAAIQAPWVRMYSWRWPGWLRGR